MHRVAQLISEGQESHRGDRCPEPFKASLDTHLVPVPFFVPAILCQGPGKNTGGELMKK